VYNDKGAQLSSYLIGLAAKDGVFVLSVSPAKKDVDPLVKELVGSFKLVPRNLDAEETKRAVVGTQGAALNLCVTNR
jgi:hypothetical protein